MKVLYKNNQKSQESRVRSGLGTVSVGTVNFWAYFDFSLFGPVSDDFLPDD